MISPAVGYHKTTSARRLVDFLGLPESGLSTGVQNADLSVNSNFTGLREGRLTVMVTCERCESDIPPGTNKYCSDCGFKFPSPIIVEPMVDDNKKTNTETKFTLAIVVFFVITVLLILGAWYQDRVVLKQQAAIKLHKTEQQAVSDAVTQYEIAKRSGDKLDVYVRAGMVAVSYLALNDENNYKKWKGIERQERRAAGLPDLE